MYARARRYFKDIALHEGGKLQIGSVHECEDDDIQLATSMRAISCLYCSTKKL